MEEIIIRENEVKLAPSKSRYMTSRTNRSRHVGTLVAVWSNSELDSRYNYIYNGKLHYLKGKPVVNMEADTISWSLREVI